MSAATLIAPIENYEVSLGRSLAEPMTAPEASGSNVARPALVIGDLHGNLNRLEALLRQEGIIGDCPDCDGTGDGIVNLSDPSENRFCSRCDGTGLARINNDVEVVLLGDLGHFGQDGSPNGDVMVWNYAIKWVDVILWGNHDRAMIEPWHAFAGFHRYPHEAFHFFNKARDLGKLKLAHAAHGWLCTHAGLHLAFRDQHVPPEVKTDPQVFADWINAAEDPDAEISREQMAVRDAISRKRGGSSHAGGILWRDIGEKLYDGFPQVFGHSADREHAVRYCGRLGYTRDREEAIHSKLTERLSYCVDVGGKGNKPGDDCLAGIWLPDERIVRVDL